MFESLTREAATRFNLGDNAARFVRMLVDAIFDSGSGGFAGMRSRFADAGLGDLFASWIGTTPGDNVLQPDQFSAGFGQSSAENIASRLGVPAAAVNMAGAGLLPKVVGLLTRGGAIPAARPAEYDGWFAAPAIAAPPAAAATTTAYTANAPAVAASGGGWWKWLLGVLVLLALAFFAFRSCAPADTAAPAAGPVATGAAPATDTAPAMPDPAATDPAAMEGAAAPAPAPVTPAAAGTPPDAAAALAGLQAGAFTAEQLVAALNLTGIQFDAGSSRISSASEDILRQAAETIQKAPAGTRVEIGGHTDNTGDASANMKLSDARAAAVRSRLVELGVDQGMLTAKGYGQDKPVADNAMEEGRAKNRRMEFNVVK